MFSNETGRILTQFDIISTEMLLLISDKVSLQIKIKWVVQI